MTPTTAAGKALLEPLGWQWGTDGAATAIVRVEAEARAQVLARVEEAVRREIRGIENISRETGRPIEDSLRISGMERALALLHATETPETRA